MSFCGPCGGGWGLFECLNLGIFSQRPSLKPVVLSNFTVSSTNTTFIPKHKNCSCFHQHTVCICTLCYNHFSLCLSHWMEVKTDTDFGRTPSTKEDSEKAGSMWNSQCLDLFLCLQTKTWGSGLLSCLFMLSWYGRCITSDTKKQNSGMLDQS